LSCRTPHSSFPPSIISYYITRPTGEQGISLLHHASEHDIDGIEEGVDNVLVSAGMELIFFSIAAVFWIWYVKNIDDTEVFSCRYEIKAVSSF